MRNFLLLVVLFQFIAALVSACFTAGVMLGKAWFELIVLMCRGIKWLILFIRARIGPGQKRPLAEPDANHVRPLKDDRPK